MVKAKYGQTPRKKIFRTILSASPTNQGFFRHYEPPEETVFGSNSTEEELIEEIANETDELKENEKRHLKSASQPRPASPEIKDVVWLIVNRVFCYCKGNIFGLVVTICFALLCIQLALLRKSLHEVGTEQKGDIVNQLITENEKFKSEVFAKIHEVGKEQMENIVKKLMTENENFESEVLSKIRDIDEGFKSVKFESLSLNINAFHNKLLKELKRRNRMIHFVETSTSSEDDEKKSLNDDNGEEATNEGKENSGWLETIKALILWLLETIKALIFWLLHLAKILLIFLDAINAIFVPLSS